MPKTLITCDHCDTYIWHWKDALIPGWWTKDGLRCCTAVCAVKHSGGAPHVEPGADHALDDAEVVEQAEALGWVRPHKYSPHLEIPCYGCGEIYKHAATKQKNLEGAGHFWEGDTPPGWWSKLIGDELDPDAPLYVTCCPRCCIIGELKLVGVEPEVAQIDASSLEAQTRTALQRGWEFRPETLGEVDGDDSP